MYEFKLPDLGEGIHEGEILSWHVNAGDPIEEDAPLVDVETDKAAVTIPSPKGGTVVSTHGKPGDVVIVGQVIAVIGTGAVSEAETEPVGRTTETEAETEAESETEAETETEEARGSELPLPPDTPAAPQPGWQGQLAAPGETDSPPSSGPVPAAPATRRLARELGVDLRQVPPSGPAGRVTADDVRRFAAGAAASPAATEPAGVERSNVFWPAASRRRTPDFRTALARLFVSATVCSSSRRDDVLAFSTQSSSVFAVATPTIPRAFVQVTSPVRIACLSFGSDSSDPLNLMN